MKEFVRQVKEMRDAQKMYVRTKSMSSLHHAKTLEARVDEAISDELSIF